MIRAQRVALGLQGKSSKRPGNVRRLPLTVLTRQLAVASPREVVLSNPLASYEIVNEYIDVKDAQKREAVKHLTKSLLRSQQFLPPNSPANATLLDAPAEVEQPDPHEIRLWLELQQWLRYFSERSQEAMLEQMKDAEEEAVGKRRSELSAEPLEEDDAHTVSEQPSTSSESTSGQQRRKRERKERNKPVPAFFSRPSASPAPAHADIHAAIKRGDDAQAMHLYHAAVRNGQELDSHILNSLFFFLTSKQQPFAAYTILQHYQKIVPAEDFKKNMSLRVNLCERLCDSLRYMDPIKHNYQEIHKLTRSTVQRVLKLDTEGQQVCVPVLVSALAMQRATRVGHYARRLYQHMIDTGLTVKDGYWEHLLSLSKYNRQHDLPYADILQRSVAVGWRAIPLTVLNALENMYPFTETKEACVAMRAIADLRMQESSDGKRYIIDLATLESLSTTAAQTANLEMTMLVWELVDVFGYQPSLALYENTVIGFASHKETYANAFIVMSEMESKGFGVSRALTRGVSTQIRDSLENIDMALGQLQQLYEDGSPISTGQLNCIMSAMAERGDISCISFILDEFKRLGLELNADSYSFALEALGKNLYRASKAGQRNEHVVRDCLERASEFLTAMEEADIVPTAHIIREYVELLCQADEIDTANEVVLEALESGTVNNKTVYRVAMALADAHHFEAARILASHLGEILPELTDNINRKEFELHRPEGI